ncbi:unnamed protein product [Aspergillus oryzae]|uniref:Unnamed protein product n=2 Tax=Aspergillus oryzae TaxID=5062 RepID=A0AAN4YM67_ASPOZ|nr:unnamed protein product [Aspergillus oryzae]GMF91435.1 unnamed protein product [Aspergillus oryzae]GMG29867.1 unnamed protein product [Aspergillus oryzae]GMG46329.1 unnamed protein product [Aspergillus oryzae var. brunneus]
MLVADIAFVIISSRCPKGTADRFDGGRVKAGFRKSAVLATAAVQWQFVGSVARAAFILRAVPNANVERTEDGNGRAHDRHATFGCGPDEHWHGIIFDLGQLYHISESEENVQMYSDAFRPDRATVRTMPHTPALESPSQILVQASEGFQAYKIPRLRPQATVIFSFCFMLRSQMMNHGRIAKEKSAATNHAGKSQTFSFMNPRSCSTHNQPSLYHNSDAGEQSDKSGDPKTSPDKPNLNFISHDSKKEGANGSFTYTNDHDTSHLAEHFIHGGFGIDNRVTDISKQSP